MTNFLSCYSELLQTFIITICGTGEEEAEKKVDRSHKRSRLNDPQNNSSDTFEFSSVSLMYVQKLSLSLFII